MTNISDKKSGKIEKKALILVEEIYLNLTLLNIIEHY
jgi:hypothetical protein